MALEAPSKPGKLRKEILENAAYNFEGDQFVANVVIGTLALSGAAINLADVEPAVINLIRRHLKTPQ